MCGIVGYIGNKNSTEILIDGLKKLEYRGYDSAGVAVFGQNGVNIVKSKGRIRNLEDKIGVNVPQGVRAGQRTASPPTPTAIPTRAAGLLWSTTES